MFKIMPAWKSFDEWNDISNEAWREYTYLVVDSNGFVHEHKMRINSPDKLWVSDNGHRIITKNGRSLYVRCGWVLLEWVKVEGCENPYEF